jgi:hypothetical protein
MFLKLSLLAQPYLAQPVLITEAEPPLEVCFQLPFMSTR